VVSEEKIVYAVSDGSYSDYGVIAIFEDEQKAEAFRKWHGYACVEKFPLNPELPEMRRGRNLYYVEMTCEGHTTVLRLERSPASTEHKTNLELDYDPGNHGSLWLGGMLWGEVVARDEQHAVKIANEKRVQLIAANEWPTDSGT